MKERKIKKGRKQVEGQVSVSCLFLVPSHVQNNTLPAYPTLVAMELSLCVVVVKEAAYLAVILSELHAALFTRVSDVLLVFAQQALDSLHFLPIHLMRVFSLRESILLLVMAKPTAPDFVAARTKERALALVVAATIRPLFLLRV